MELLIAKIIALGLASGISPMIFAASILLITNEKNPVRKICAFIAGGMAVALTLAILTMQVWEGNILLSQPAASSGEKSIISSILALLMILTGAYILISRKKSKMKIAIPDSALQIFFMGVLLYAGNFKSLLINLVALREIFDSSLSFGVKIICFVLSDFLLLLPSIFPLIVYLFARKDSEKIIIPIRHFFDKYGTRILAVVCIVLGAWMLS